MTTPDTPAESAALAPLELPSTPDTTRPFLAGTFALYLDHDGSVVMVSDIDGRGVEHHRIPKAMVAMAMNAAGGGGVMGKLGGLFGGRRG